MDTARLATTLGVRSTPSARRGRSARPAPAGPPPAGALVLAGACTLQLAISTGMLAYAEHFALAHVVTIAQGFVLWIVYLTYFGLPVRLPGHLRRGEGGARSRALGLVVAITETVFIWSGLPMMTGFMVRGSMLGAWMIVVGIGLIVVTTLWVALARRRPLSACSGLALIAAGFLSLGGALRFATLGV